MVIVGLTNMPDPAQWRLGERAGSQNGGFPRELAETTWCRKSQPRENDAYRISYGMELFGTKALEIAKVGVVSSNLIARSIFGATIN